MADSKLIKITIAEMSFAANRIKIHGADKRYYNYWIPDEEHGSDEEAEFRKGIVAGVTLYFDLLEVVNPHNSKAPYRNIYMPREKPPAIEDQTGGQQDEPQRITDRERQDSIRIQNSITNAVNYLLGLSAQGKIELTHDNMFDSLSYMANFIFHIEPKPIGQKPTPKPADKPPESEKPSEPVPDPATPAQIKKIQASFGSNYNIASEDLKHEIGANVLKKEKLESFKELSKVEASKLIDMMLNDKDTVNSIITAMGIREGGEDPFAAEVDEEISGLKGLPEDGDLDGLPF